MNSKMAQRDHEGLKPDYSQPDYSGLEVAADTQEKYVLDNRVSIIRSERICGFPKRTFWIVAAIVGIIVVAAGLGGGIGGSRSKSSARYGMLSNTISI